jgi:hypothetical protein
MSDRWNRVHEKAVRRAWRRANSGHPLFVQADLAVDLLYARMVPWWASR